jgi:hypothetical protein
MLAALRATDQVPFDPPTIQTVQFIADHQRQAIVHPFTA